jgi:hypothetical protein
MRPLLFALIALPGLLAACDNSCQQICDRMASYAENDCGITVSKDDIQACKDEQAGSASRDDRAVCREFNSKKTIAEEWDCEELSAYWPDAGSAPEAEE